MFKFVNSEHYNHIVIVGCGGTGARMLPPLIQLVKSAHWILNPKITLIDFDEVEPKNLVRQNFIKDDVGRNKAEVLAERYSTNLDIDMRFSNRKIGPDEGLGKNIKLVDVISECWKDNKPSLSNTIVIMAVDSVEARVAIVSELCFNITEAVPIIDTGNEDSFGQVSLFHSTTILPHHLVSEDSIQKMLADIPERIDFELTLENIPAPIYTYLTMTKGSGTGSCADMDQTLPINHMMASLALSYLQSLLYSMPIYTYRVSISLDGISIPCMLDMHWFRNVVTGQSDWGKSLDESPTVQEIEDLMQSNNVGFAGFFHGKEYSLSNLSYVGIPGSSGRNGTAIRPKAFKIERLISDLAEHMPSSMSRSRSMLPALDLLYKVVVKGEPLPS